MCSSSRWRLVHLACVVAIVGFVAAQTSVSFADGCPADCSANRFNIDVQADKFAIVNGETVNYRVNAFNNLANNGGCDAGVSSCDAAFGHGVIIQFCCPSPSGVAYPLFDFAPGHCTELSAPGVGDSFPTVPPQNSKIYPDVPCVVNVNPGVTTATGIAAGGDATNPNNPSPLLGTIHFPAGDRGVQASKPIPLGIAICGDGQINQPSCEKCDGAAFPSNAPTSHGPCRTGNTCGVDACTFCGDGVVNGGEQCDDGNNNNNDGCRNDCILPVCGDNIIDVTAACTEKCDGTAFPAGAPSSHGPCRTTGTCGTEACTFCGDGIVNGGEQCDDGNNVNTDNCRNNCTIPVCGDNIIDVTATCTEKCDGTAFPAGAPAGHGPCRTTGTCGAEACTFCGDGVRNGGEECDFADPATPTCLQDCTLPRPCSVIIAKTVAPDDGSGGGTACDGVADGPFVENVTVDHTSCVVYQICVTNTGQQVLNSNGVKVSDPVLGIVNVDFGTIAVGAPQVCRLVPSAITAPACTGGTPAGTSCVCEQVQGVNTANISAAVCQTTQVDACTQPNSDCSDTATVACIQPGSCRMTGGHNFDVVDAEFDDNGKVYTTGGQIGAPNETGCCDLPPKGKCVSGRCTGGLNGGNACTSNDQCPNDPGRNSHCPWGDWEHNHHSGGDDTGSLTSGSFSFHSGTAAAPDAAFIKSVLCADPGWCVQARPAPFKQIFWEGTGVFHNEKSRAGRDIPLPRFAACGTNQPVPYSRTGGTLHYYKAHVGDFGEPAGIFQNPTDQCDFADSCTNPEPNGILEISRGAGNVCPSVLNNVCEIQAEADPVKTALHPLCLAETCSNCPDLYEIEIHCTADPGSPVAYRVSHFIRQGNFQLHPPVGDSCNPSCGDGVCEGGVTGTAETCQSCPGDCGPCARR